MKIHERISKPKLSNITHNGRRVCQEAVDWGYSDPMQVGGAGGEWLYTTEGLHINIFTGAWYDENQPEFRSDE